jgi:outer membrane protein OmpA-like peptidoglycan-associated protein
MKDINVMKNVIAGVFILAIFGVLGIAAYAVNQSDGCVRLGVPPYMKLEHCRTHREFQPVYFESGKSEIPHSDYDTVYGLRDYLKKNNCRVTLIGHTDRDRGINNERLSYNRANRVKIWLENHGIEKERITAYGKGHSNPVLKQNDQENQQLSRRVEIEIRCE